MGLRAALIAVLWLAGCSASGEDPTRSPDGSQPASPVGPGSASPGTPGTIDLPASILDPIVAQIAADAGVPVDQVTVISAVAVTFPDGSLGCPEPGMSYTQALVDGYHVVAEAGGTTYDYRGSGGTFRRCLNPG